MKNSVYICFQAGLACICTFFPNSFPEAIFSTLAKVILARNWYLIANLKKYDFCNQAMFMFLNLLFTFLKTAIFAISPFARVKKLASAFALMSSKAGAINQVALQKGSYLYLHIEFEKYEQKVDLGGGILLYNLPQKVNQNRQKHLLNKVRQPIKGFFSDIPKLYDMYLRLLNIKVKSHDFLSRNFP